MTIALTTPDVVQGGRTPQAPGSGIELGPLRLVADREDERLRVGVHSLRHELVRVAGNHAGGRRARQTGRRVYSGRSNDGEVEGRQCTRRLGISNRDLDAGVQGLRRARRRARQPAGRGIESGPLGLVRNAEGKRVRIGVTGRRAELVGLSDPGDSRRGTRNLGRVVAWTGRTGGWAARGAIERRARTRTGGPAAATGDEQGKRQQRDARPIRLFQHGVPLTQVQRGAVVRNRLLGCGFPETYCATSKTGRWQPRYPRNSLVDRRLCVPALRQVCLCLELPRIMTTPRQKSLRIVSQNGYMPTRFM